MCGRWPVRESPFIGQSGLWFVGVQFVLANLAAKLVIAQSEEIGGDSLVEPRALQRGGDQFPLELSHPPGQVNGQNVTSSNNFAAPRGSLTISRITQSKRRIKRIESDLRNLFRLVREPID